MKSLILKNKIFNEDNEFILNSLTLLIGENKTGKSEVIRELKDNRNILILKRGKD